MHSHSSKKYGAASFVADAESDLLGRGSGDGYELETRIRVHLITISFLRKGVRPVGQDEL